MWHIPTTSVCYFRDVWLLRSLWFQNLAMFDQLKDLDYTTGQQCVLFAVRSMLSLYVAILTGVCVFVSRSAKGIPTANWPGLIVLSVSLLGFLFFWDGFYDQYHGYRAEFTYRTSDSINMLIAKSILRMISVSTLIVVWALQVIGLWHRNERRSDNK